MNTRYIRLGTVNAKNKGDIYTHHIKCEKSCATYIMGQFLHPIN